MMKHGPRFLELVNESRACIHETTVSSVKERVDRGDRFWLVDVREESEWNQGRLRGAMHLCKGIIERDVEEAIPDPDAEIVLYCGGGFRSALAADNLRRMGYTNVASMDGGYRGWKEAGFPIETDPS